MNSEPRVTVAIPVYNSAPTLERAIRSAMRQTLRNIEILVADDGSTDGSAAIAERLSAEDPRIIVHRILPNGGKPRAMNRMVAAARGAWIAVLDADDAFHDDRLTQLVTAAEAAGVEMVADNLLYVDAGADQVVRSAFPVSDGPRQVTKADLARHADTYADFDFGILKPIMRRDFLRTHGLTYTDKTRLSEDFYYLLTFFLAGGRGLVLPTPLYYWTMPFGTISRSWTETGSGAWRYDYREALQANEHFLNVMTERGEAGLAAMLRARSRQYRVMIDYLGAQRMAAEGDRWGALRRIAGHPGTWRLLLGRVLGRVRRAVAPDRRVQVVAEHPPLRRAGAPRVLPATRILVVSASDSAFMPLLRGMIASLDRTRCDLACFDIGLAPADRAWLAAQGVAVAVPGPHLGIDAAVHRPALLSFLARPFLPSYFPGYDVYAWIDSDVWLQDTSVLDRYVAGALAQGLAVTHERERGYRFQAWLFGWTAKHMLLGYGPGTAAYLLSRPHVNAGFFAIAADAPHWAAWADRYAAAIGRTGALVPHDQFALNHALHAGPFRRALPAALLDPGCNWICDRGVPMWNDAQGAFCKPYAPHEPIGALHLAGPAKRTVYTIMRTGGGQFRTMLVHGARPDAPVLVSPLEAPAALPVAA